jgi:AmpE protein
MKFLTVLIVVLIQQNWVGSHPIRDLFRIDGWFDWVDELSSADLVRFSVAVILPFLLLLWISIVLSGWVFGLLYLALSIVVVLYAVELIDLDTRFTDQRLWLGSVDPADSDDDAVLRAQDRFVADTVYDSFRSVVPALFWFLLLGPAGTLAYVLCDQYASRSQDASGDNSDSVAHPVLYWMEWLPARVCGVLYALLGDFRQGMAAVLATAGDTNNSVASTLSDTARGSIHVAADSAARPAAEYELNELQWLLERNIWGWVGLAALLTILGW